MPTSFSGGADRAVDDHSAIVEGPRRVVATRAANCFRKSPRVWFWPVIAVPWAIGAKTATAGIGKVRARLVGRYIGLLVKIAQEYWPVIHRPHRIARINRVVQQRVHAVVAH